MSFAEKVLTFHGRLRRRDWWTFAALLLLVDLVLVFAVMGLMGAPVMPNTFGARPGFDLGVWREKRNLAYLLVSLVTLWPALAIGIKRLHDRGRSGWWAGLFSGLWFLALFLTVVRLQPGSGAAYAMPGQVVSWAILLLGLWLLVEMGVMGGTRGPNRYGESPKDR